MQFKRVGRVAMRHLGFEICRQVDNVYGAKRTLFGADPALNTKRFGNVRDFAGPFDFDTKLAYTKQRRIDEDRLVTCMLLTHTIDRTGTFTTEDLVEIRFVMCVQHTILVDISWAYTCQH